MRNLLGNRVGILSATLLLCFFLNCPSTVMAQSDAVTTDSERAQLQFATVVSGADHTCALDIEGHILCWGRNNHSQGTVPEGTSHTLAAGGAHSCGLVAAKTVHCGGQNDHGQTDTPALQFWAMSAGGAHTCGLSFDGIAHCWGKNDHGQIAAAPGPFSTISAGKTHTCGVNSEGTVSCWGHLVGPGKVAPPGNITDVPTGRFKMVASGQLHACGLSVDGLIQCWEIIFSTNCKYPQVNSGTYQPVIYIHVGWASMARYIAGVVTPTDRPIHLRRI